MEDRTQKSGVLSGYGFDTFFLFFTIFASPTILVWKRGLRRSDGEATSCLP